MLTIQKFGGIHVCTVDVCVGKNKLGMIGIIIVGYFSIRTLHMYMYTSICLVQYVDYKRLYQINVASLPLSLPSLPLSIPPPLYSLDINSRKFTAVKHHGTFALTAKCHTLFRINT